MHEMSRDEWRAFLLEGTRTAKLATTRKDGHPHVSPIWFLLDGDDLMFTTHETSVRLPWSRSLRSPLPHAAGGPGAGGPGPLSVDGSSSGDVRVAPDGVALYGARNGVPGELLVRVTPTKILARAGIAD